MARLLPASAKPSAASIFSAAVLAGCIGFVALPARAADDGQQSLVSSVLGMFGLDPGKSSEQIEYRERPPLVLPPKMQLRQPQQPVADRNPSWPLDPDVVKRQREADAARQTILPLPKDDDRLTKQQLAARRAGGAAPPQPFDICSINDRAPSCHVVPWNKLTDKSKGAANTLTAGQEPPRATLTEPPKGYRIATKTVKATTDAPEKENDSPLSFLLPKKTTDE